MDLAKAMEGAWEPGAGAEEPSGVGDVERGLAGEIRRVAGVERRLAEAGAFTTLQASLHAADRTVAPPRFDPASQPNPGASLPRTLASPRTHTGWLP